MLNMQYVTNINYERSTVILSLRLFIRCGTLYQTHIRNYIRVRAKFQLGDRPHYVTCHKPQFQKLYTDIMLWSNHMKCKNCSSFWQNSHDNIINSLKTVKFSVIINRNNSSSFVSQFNGRMNWNTKYYEISQLFRNEELPQQRNTSGNVAVSDKGHKGGRGAEERVIWKWILKTCDVRMYSYIHVAGDKSRFPVATVLNSRLQYEEENALKSWVNMSFWRMSLFYGAIWDII
jgi:hypothetical protein